MFEVNFGGMKRAGLLTPYPDRFLMEHLCRLNARITLQADAHAPNALGEGWDEAIRYAKEAGFAMYTGSDRMPYGKECKYRGKAC